MRSFLVVTFMLLSVTVSAAPSADLWDHWVPQPRAWATIPDHSGWDAFLKRYVRTADDGVNRVDYRAAKREGHAQLTAYLESMEAIEPRSLARGHAMAYWMNLYNALTIDVVLKHYPVTSIRQIDISPGFFTSGPWGAKLIEIEGVALSLDEIEHRILRPIWQDPRIHYGVNCASIGCPNLLTAAFTASQLEQQLDLAARDFINHRRAVAIVDGELEVSSIFDWFGDDFGGNDASVIAHLYKFAEPPLQRQLKGRSRIDDDHYDWSLNDFRNAE